ncbi:hypothetical protein VNO77_20770 [Canavalia gladiata]|uniref:Uncharacterized protein n=1 Tax=Canavalia gladiata TaxID=3824 RepID=A0AAN9LQ07_CANGL
MLSSIMTFWVYLFLMFISIVFLLAFIIFPLLSLNKDVKNAFPNRGYKNYKLGDYSGWLSYKKVNNANTWKKITNCLHARNLYSNFKSKSLNNTVDQFYVENLSTFQSRY